MVSFGQKINFVLINVPHTMSDLFAKHQEAGIFFVKKIVFLKKIFFLRFS